jgi:ceramide glucosyltransferase
LAAEPAEDAAATKLVRKTGFRISLVRNPFPQPLGARSADEVWRRQLRWARLRRMTFKHFYVLEILTGGLPALLAGAIVAAAAGLPVGASVLGIAAIWYGAEALLAHAVGWRLSWWSPWAWLLRDILIPVLWATSWVGNGFVWRGNAMQLADRKRPG